MTRRIRRLIAAAALALALALVAAPALPVAQVAAGELGWDCGSDCD